MNSLMNKPKDCSDVELKIKWTAGAIKSYRHDQFKEERGREREREETARIMPLKFYSSWLFQLHHLLSDKFFFITLFTHDP